MNLQFVPGDTLHPSLSVSELHDPVLLTMRARDRFGIDKSSGVSNAFTTGVFIVGIFLFMAPTGIGSGRAEANIFVEF